MATATRIVKAPRGTSLMCKGWPQEAALRMLMNNLDPDVAERPDDLIVYGGSGKAARNWPAYEAIVQGTYETLAAVARRHFGGSLTSRLFVTAGLGGMGGAQPLAAVMNGATALVIEIDPQRIARRLATKYLDEATDSLDVALDRAQAWARSGTARSIALRGNAADVLPTLVDRGVTPDVLTDQTAAHDALNGYVPNGLSLDDAVRLRQR